MIGKDFLSKEKIRPKMKILSPKIILIIIIPLCLTCLEIGFVKERNRKRKPQREPVTKTIQKLSETDTVRKEDTTPGSLPIPEWKGKKFRLLEKTKMFQNYGYELYTSPLFSEDTTPADTNFAHENHRLKYDPFKATNIAATAVEKMEGGGYRVTFKTDTFQLAVYGRTRKGMIEGLALYSDFDAAEKRWKDKTVYSRRRSIETYDSTHSRYQSVKVSITEPLNVITVRWGITPLPPKSLWLIVERQNGFRGFIPINYSWTNVLQTEETASLPWENDIFEQNPKEIYNWEDRIWKTIDKHNISTQMTTEQVQFSWGKPINSYTKIDSEGKEKTIYLYRNKKLTFRNDTLIFTFETDTLTSDKE